MLKTVILDCDGVMFDSKGANHRYYDFLLQSFGCNPMDEAELEYVHIHNVWKSVEHIFRHYPEISITDVHTFRMKHDYAPFLKYMKMEDDLLPFLYRTQNRYNLAISTNRTNTMIPILDEFQLTPFFGKVMTAENSRKPKPAPDSLLEIIEYFSCSLEEAVYVGDSTIDEQAAAACGMKFIAFRNPHLQAAFHVTSFSAILQLPIFEQED